MSAGFATLGSVAEFINGAAFTPADWGEDGKPIVRIQNLTDPTKPFNRTKREVAEKLHVHPGDLLVSWSASLGVFEWRAPEVAVLNQHIFRVLPDRTRVDKRYLRYGLERALLDMKRHLHGATMQHVNRGEFLATKLYFPSLPQQRRIAEILDKADALQARRRVALAQLDTLTRSIFIEMFGDPATNPKGWRHERLTSACQLYSGGTPSKADPENWRGSLPWFSPKDFKQDDLFDSEDHINESIPATTNLKLLSANTVAIVVRGMILAHTFPVSVLRIPATINQDVKALVPVRRIDAQFLAHCVRAQSNSVLAYVSESAHGTKRLDGEGLAKIRVLDVPIERQREFAGLVVRSEQVKSKHSDSLAATDNLFASLQHRAFRGEL
jgi:type I restriction enzyme S subunit